MRLRARRPSQDESGFTLVELVISIVVISIALTGTLIAMQRTNASSADPMIVRQAVSVAEAYLAEILYKPYLDPNSVLCPAPNAGGRTEYDNICDYDALDDNGARDQNDAAMSGLSRYRVRVDVDPNATLGALSGPTDVVRIDVRVTHPDRVDFTLSGYRANF